MIAIPRHHADDAARDALRSLPQLAALDGRGRGALLRHFDRTAVAAGTRLATAGRSAAEAFIVISGRLCAVGFDATSEVQPGQAIGWEALATGAPWPVSVTAAEPTELLVMSRAQFRAVRALATA